ncbi:MAG: hypothetical protein OJJ21_06940 [Ferrovibrio sp.]|uniref:hypothetical protein n=1 Tax=Ferrovibrio sp. TaxID=1917215 RepID=UPI002619FE14|nr:hypothetical protein [Ferrovibrio sp.]MCW0233315.1 hypothetical protein [Ferrovibrio sp.]
MALSGTTAEAQSALPSCPLIVGPMDAGLCQIAALPDKYDPLLATSRSSLALLAYNPDDGNYLLTRRPLFTASDVSLLSRRSDSSAMALPGHDMLAQDGDRIGVYSEQDAAPGALNKAYDVPLFDGLALSNTSAISQSGGMDNESRSASSKFGLAYEEYGLTFKVDPDAAANWGDLAGSGSRRFGIDNSISAMIARDLTLTLSSGYTTESTFGNPASASSNERHRVAIAQHFSSGYKLGASLQRRNEYRYQEERDLNVLGLQIGVPLGETLNLTASHEFGLGEKRNLSDADAVPFYGKQQSLDLQLHWTPAALASRAMTIMAGYAVSQDDMAGTDDGYLTQARLNLAMRF